MRVVGDIAHPNCKITIFQTTSRFSVKFEQGVFEQTYKFRIGTLINNIGDVKAVITPSFTEEVIQQFETMDRIKREGFSKFKDTVMNEFDDII